MDQDASGCIHAAQASDLARSLTGSEGATPSVSTTRSKRRPAMNAVLPRKRVRFGLIFTRGPYTQIKGAAPFLRPIGPRNHGPVSWPRRSRPPLMCSGRARKEARGPRRRRARRRSHIRSDRNWKHRYDRDRSPSRGFSLRRNFVRGMAATPFALWLARSRADALGHARALRHRPARWACRCWQTYANAVRLMKLRADSRSAELDVAVVHAFRRRRHDQGRRDRPHLRRRRRHRRAPSPMKSGTPASPTPARTTTTSSPGIASS